MGAESPHLANTEQTRARTYARRNATARLRRAHALLCSYIQSAVSVSFALVYVVCCKRWPGCSVHVCGMMFHVACATLHVARRMLRRYYNFWLSADEVFVNDTLQNVSVAGMMQVACSISRIGRSGNVH